MIDRFDGQYRFLSNFYCPCFVVVNGLRFPSSEHAYQAFKSKDPKIIEEFTSPDIFPNKAKKMGRELVCREDWDDICVQVMYKIVRNKFFQNKDIGDKLIRTGDAVLIEGNYWGDSKWGVDRRTNVGENLLGQVLMLVRSELRLCGYKK